MATLPPRRLSALAHAVLVVALFAAGVLWQPPVQARAATPGLPQAEAPAGQRSEESAAAGEEPAAAAKGGEGLQMENLIEGDPLKAGTWKRLWSRLLEGFVESLPDLLYALIVLAFFAVLYLAVAGLLRGLLRRSKADPALNYIALRLAKYTLLSLALIMAASQLGFQVGSLLAGLGVLGLAVGLAAQDTLSNLIAGLTILWDRPFRTGDNVTIAGTFGRVMKVGLRSTWIRTVDQLDAILPNKEVINQKIINHTLYPKLRLDIPLGIAYWEDSREARKVLLAAVADHPLLAEDSQHDVVVTSLGDSSVNLSLRVWLKDPHREREALWDIVERSKIALDAAGIDIPFPQRTLHLGDAGVRRVLDGTLVGRGAEGPLDEGAGETGRSESGPESEA